MRISPTELQAVLARYPILSPEVSTAVSPETTGFSGAGVVRVETALGPVAVRRWPRNWPAERLRGLHRLLTHIGRQGIGTVAIPFRACDGETLVEMSGSWWQIEPWLPGVANYHRQPSRMRLAAAMQALARWHQAANGFRSQGTESLWFRPPGTGVCPAVEERLETLTCLTPTVLKDWESQAVCHVPPELQPFPTKLVRGILQAIPSVFAGLSAVRQATVPLQVCLRDVWHDHVLYSADRVTGLIDPAASRMDSVAVDLARLLGSLVEDQSEDWAFALAEYSRHRALTLSEERLVPVLDRSGVVLSAITWLRWLGPEDRRWSDYTAVTDRLQRLTRRLQHANCCPFDTARSATACYNSP